MLQAEAMPQRLEDVPSSIRKTSFSQLNMEQQRIRRSLSSLLQRGTASANLGVLRKQPSPDILMRSFSGDKSIGNITFLKTRPGSPIRSVKGNRKSQASPKLGNVKLPPIANNGNRLRLQSRPKLSLKHHQLVNITQPSTSLADLVDSLREEGTGRFYYARFDGYLNFMITSQPQHDWQSVNHSLSTISAGGVMHCAHECDTLYFAAAEINTVVGKLLKLQKNSFYRGFPILRIFGRWKLVARYKRFLQSQSALRKSLDVLDGTYRLSLGVCSANLSECYSERIFLTRERECVPIEQYSSCLERLLRNSQNILNESFVISIIREAIQPLKTKLEQALNNSRFTNISLASDEVGCMRFIRKLLYLISEARLSYVNGCYAQLTDAVTEALLPEESNGGSETMATLPGITCRVTILNNGLLSELTESQVTRTLMQFLHGLVGKMQYSRYLVRGVDPVTKEFIRQALSVLIALEQWGLASHDIHLVSVKSQLTDKIHETFERLNTHLRLRSPFVSEILQYLNQPPTGSYEFRLNQTKSYTERCQRLFAPTNIGILRVNMQPVYRCLTDMLQVERKTVHVEMHEQFMQTLAGLKLAMRKYDLLASADLQHVQEFVSCCILSEDYDQAKLDAISKPQAKLNSLLTLMEDASHQETKKCTLLSNSIERVISELDSHVSAFRGKLPDQLRMFDGRLKHMSSQALSQLKSIQTTCLSNLQQAFPSLLMQFYSQIKVLEEVEKNIRVIEVLERLAGVPHPSQFELAQILKFELVNVVALLQDFTQFRQTLIGLEKCLYQQINLKELVLYLDETIDRLKSKLKPLHQFERLLSRLLRYFQQQKCAIQTVMNLQQLQPKQLQDVNEKSARGMKHLQKWLTQPTTLSRLLDANIHEYHDTTAELLRKKESAARLHNLQQELETYWESAHITYLRRQNIDLIQNLSELVEKLEDYEISLKPFREQVGQLADQHRMVVYSIAMLQQLRTEQVEMERIHELVSSCELQSDAYRGCLASWQGVIAWLRNSKLKRVANDHASQHLGQTLRKTCDLLQQTGAHLDALVESECAHFPKLYFFGKARVLTMLNHKPQFFLEYYPILTSAVEHEYELTLVTKHQQTICLQLPPQKDKRTLADYDQTLKQSIKANLMRLLDGEEEEPGDLLRLQELGQAILCVDQIRLCARLDAITSQLPQFNQELERIAFEVDDLRQARKTLAQASYEQTDLFMLQTMLLARICARQRLHNERTRKDFACWTRVRDGNIFMEALGCSVPFEYELVDFMKVVAPYSTSQRNNFHMLSAICSRKGGLIYSAQPFEQLAASSMRVLNRSPITADTSLQKLTALANCSSWACLDICGAAGDVLSMLARWLHDIQHYLKLNNHKNKILLGGKSIRIIHQPVLYLCLTGKQNTEAIPRIAGSQFKPISWMPPAAAEVARLTLLVKGIESQEALSCAQTLIGLFDTHLFLKRVPSTQAESAVEITQSIMGQFAAKYARDKPLDRQLITAVKSTLLNAEQFQQELKLVEEKFSEMGFRVSKTGYRKSRKQLTPEADTPQKKIEEVLRATEFQRIVNVMGPQWSGKTSTINAALKKAGVPNSYKFNLAVGASGQSTASRLAKIIKGFGTNETWLLLQNPYGQDESLYFERLYSESRILLYGNGESLVLPDSLTIVWELQSLSALPISAVLHSRTVVLGHDLVPLQDFYLQKVDYLLTGCTQTSALRPFYINAFKQLQGLFEVEFEPFKLAPKSCSKQILSDTLRLMEAYLRDTAFIEEQSLTMVAARHQTLLYYCFAMVLSACTVHDQRPQISRYVRKELLKDHCRQSIFECVFAGRTQGCSMLCQPKIQPNRFPAAEMEKVLVHTADTAVLSDIANRMLGIGASIYIIGDGGCGKSLFARNCLRNLTRRKVLLKCSSGSSWEQVERVISRQVSTHRTELVVLIEDVGMTANTTGLYEYFKTGLEQSKHNEQPYPQLVVEHTTNLLNECAVTRELFPLRMRAPTSQHILSIFQSVLMGCMPQNMLDAHKVTHISQSFLECLNGVSDYLKRKLQHPPLLLQFGDFGNELIYNFRTLAPAVVCSADTAADMLMYSLSKLVRRVAESQEQRVSLDNLVERTTKNLLYEISPLYDPEENYYLFENEQTTKVDRQTLCEEIRARLKHRLNLPNLLLFDQAFIDTVYEVSLAVYQARSIVFVAQGVSHAEQLNQLIGVFGGHFLAVPLGITAERLMEMLRQILQRPSKDLLYLSITDASEAPTQQLLRLLQTLFCELQDELEGKKLPLKQFNKQIRIALCVNADEFTLVSKQKDLLRSCTVIRTTHLSKTGINKLVDTAVDAALFNQSRSLQWIVSDQDKRSSVRSEKRNSSLFVKQRNSQFLKIGENKQSIPEQLKKQLNRALSLILQSGQPLLDYARHSHRIHHFLTSFSLLLQLKQNRLMYRKAAIEASKDTLKLMSSFVQAHNLRSLELSEERNWRTRELLEVQARKNMRSISFAMGCEHVVQNQSIPNSARIHSIQNMMASKTVALQHLRQEAQNAFHGIHRGDISQIRAEFNGNLEAVKPLFEAICLMLDEPAGLSSIKRVLFDANFKSRLTRGIFKKRSDEFLWNLQQQVREFPMQGKLTAMHGLHEWIRVGVHHETMKRKTKVELATLESKMKQLEEERKKIIPQGKSLTIDSYEDLCQIEDKLIKELKELSHRAALHANTEVYTSNIQRLCFVQCQWLNLLEQSRREDQQLFSDCVEASFRLTFGGIDQLNKLYHRLPKDTLSIVQPKPLSLGNFLRQLCSPTKRVCIPTAPALRDKIMAILHLLEQSRQPLLLLSSQFEIGCYFSCEGCLFLSAKSQQFERSVLQCIESGQWLFVLGGYQLEHKRLMTLVINACLTAKATLLWKGSSVAIHKDFRILLVGDSLDSISRCPEAVVVEFRPVDSELARCLAAGLAKPLFDFDMEEAQRNLQHIEAATSHKMFELLCNLSHKKPTQQQGGNLPLSQQELQGCLRIWEELLKNKVSLLEISESLEKINNCNRQLFRLAEKLVLISRVYNRSTTHESISRGQLVQIVIDVIHSIQKEAGQASPHFRNILRMFGKIELIIDKAIQQLIYKLESNKGVALVIAIHWQQLRTQGKISEQDLSLLMATDSAIEQAMFPTYLTRREMAVGLARTSQLQRIEFQACLQHLRKVESLEEGVLLAEMGKFQLTLGQASYIKRLLTPVALLQEMQLLTAKYDVNAIQWDNQIHRQQLFENIRLFLGLPFQNISRSQRKEKLRLASCSEYIATVEEAVSCPITQHRKWAHKRSIAQFQRLRDRLIDEQQRQTPFETSPFEQDGLYQRLKKEFARCQYYQKLLVQSCEDRTLIDLEVDDNPSMHLAVLLDGGTIQAAEQSNLYLVKGVHYLPITSGDRENSQEEDQLTIQIPTPSRPLEVHVSPQAKLLLKVSTFT